MTSGEDPDTEAPPAEASYDNEAPPAESSWDSSRGSEAPPTESTLDNNPATDSTSAPAQKTVC